MNKEADQPKEPDSQEQELPKIGKEKLQEILAQHKRWVESEGKEGARADLRRANLHKAALFRANLQEVFLTSADLQQAVLAGANLQKAGLVGANLQEADLREVIGLTQEQLDWACGDAETMLPPGMFIKPCPEESN